MTRATAAGILLIGLASRSPAQSAPGGRPEFEVASVKQVVRTDGRVVHSLQSKPRNLSSLISGNGLRMPLETLKGLILDAYNVREDQLAGIPDWADDTLQYEIVAKAPGLVNPEQVRLMLQSLLADRFQLRLRHEQKNLTVYEMTIAKSGLQRELFPEGAPGRHDSWAMVPMLIEFFLDYPIVDKTGLTGYISGAAPKWDDDKLSEEMREARPAGLPTGVRGHGLAPSIFHEAEAAFGVSLKKVTAPSDFLVVEHVERPSDN